MHFFIIAASAAVMATPAWAWGKEGHKMTAAIAQIHLLPSARQAICSILPPEANCSLASVATWPDDVRKKDGWEWSAKLHFVNGIGDNPPKDCSLGAKGWEKPSDFHVLNAIVNMTRRVESSNGTDRDLSLRFLTHFLGDIHQPLHLTGLFYGGNNVPILFDKKPTRLHAAWDDNIVLQRIVSANSTGYAHRLQTSPKSELALERNRRIEAALTGLNYDPLVRWIVYEGIDNRWASKIQEWTTCPQWATRLQGDQQVMRFEKLPFEDPSNLPVCPYHWAKASHQLLCDFIWRPDLQGEEHMENAVYNIELDTPEYAGQAGERKIIEEQIAKGGLRLAVALNTILGSEEEKRAFGVLFGIKL